MSRLLTISAIASVAAFCQAASAQSVPASQLAAAAYDPSLAPVVRHVRVSFGDLDIASREGARALIDRIGRAARMACGGSPQFSSDYLVAPTFVTHEYELCRMRAESDAVASINAPEVTRLYDRYYRPELKRLARI